MAEYGNNCFHEHETEDIILSGRAEKERTLDPGARI